MSPFAIARFVAALLLFGALANHPYVYYQFLRWAVCPVSAYGAYLAYEEKRTTWAWIFGIIAVVFNPISPFYMTREIWSFLDVGAGIIFLGSLAGFKESKTISKN